MAGPRSFRSVAGALFLLSLFVFVIYSAIAANAPERDWFVFWGTPFVPIMLALVLPEGQLRRGSIRLAEYSLVAVGIGLVAGNLLHLWTAASDGRAIFPSRGPRKYWVNEQEQPLRFWLSVVSSAFTLWLATSALRGYFTRVFSRRG
jgi:hypothetical protein